MIETKTTEMCRFCKIESDKIFYKIIGDKNGKG